MGSVVRALRLVFFPLQADGAESDQTITFVYFRLLKLLRFKVQQKTVLHLVRREDGFRVETIGDPHLNMSWTKWPLVGHL